MYPYVIPSVRPPIYSRVGNHLFPFVGSCTVSASHLSKKSKDVGVVWMNRDYRLRFSKIYDVCVSYCTAVSRAHDKLSYGTVRLCIPYVSYEASYIMIRTRVEYCSQISFMFYVVLLVMCYGTMSPAWPVQYVLNTFI